MSVRIIRGAAGSGKSEMILKMLGEHAKKGEKAMLIVPEQFSHIAETQLINAVVYLSPNIQATSFARLAKRLLTEAGRSGLTIDAAGKNMLMASVLLKKSKDLTVFKGASEKAGFITALLDLISDFKRAQISCDQLLEYSQNEKNALFSQKLSELGEIYKNYDEVLSKNFVDNEDNVTKLAQLIGEENPLKDFTIYIDSFFRFTANEFDVLSSMLENGINVVVSVCAPEKINGASSIFKPCIDTQQRILNMAKKCGATVLENVYLNEKYRFRGSLELAHLESQLYSYPNEIYNERTKDISLFIASNPYSEVVYLATQIRKAILNDNLRYRDIAIIAGNLDLYSDIIKNVFPAYDIPVFVDDRHELLSHPVMLMLFSVFSMLTSGFKTQDVIAFCKSGYSGLSQNETDRLENYALLGHIERTDWLNDERFLKRAGMVFEAEKELTDEEKTEAIEMLAIKNKMLLPVVELKQAFSENREVRARAEALFVFFEKTGLRETVENQVAQFKEDGLLELADEYADVYNILIETLDQLVLCIGEEKIGIERLKVILENGFSQHSVGVIPSACDQVFLGDVSRSLVKNVKLVFLAGVQDGSFPPAAPNEGILTDSERISLNQHGFEVAPDTKKMTFDNQFSVYNAVNISSKKVHISYAVADFNGKGLRPSSFVARIKKLFPNLVINSELLDAETDPEKAVASKQSAYNYLIGRLSDDSESIKELTEVLCEDEEYIAQLNQANEYSHFVNLSQPLTKDNVEALYGRSLKGSISRFEKFSGCPFAYFVQFGLKAKERKILEIDTPDIGSLLHLIVDEFSKYMQKNGESYKHMTREKCEQIVDELVSKMTSNMFIENLYSKNKLAVLIKRLKQMVMKSVWVICEHVKRGEFEPCGFEVAFDENGEMPPVVINLPTGEKITLAGRIDRIDKYSDGTNLYIRIIDYKSGNKEFSLNDIFNKLSLQLAVYLTAVCDGGEQLLGQTPKPAGMFYFRLNDPLVKTMEISEEKLSEEIIKKYKMSGLVLSDTDVIKAMDSGISGFSKIIPVRINKDGNIIESSSKCASLSQMEKLQKYMKRTVAEIGREILNGNTYISPCVNGKQSACTYCKFKSVCGFDSAHNKIRYVKNLPDR
ncbi:MAG: helicase-exonuclease AddAB subunit AddB, partial [Clostridia bacterium]|nr:helicase-exonuclease AddAB subunit AddB [Clostridia bacterium]